MWNIKKQGAGHFPQIRNPWTLTLELKLQIDKWSKGRGGNLEIT